ncbi:hypothetical protein ACOME3_005644 [Neoechinorhynchus agilis]
MSKRHELIIQKVPSKSSIRDQEVKDTRQTNANNLSQLEERVRSLRDRVIKYELIIKSLQKKLKANEKKRLVETVAAEQKYLLQTNMDRVIMEVLSSIKEKDKIIEDLTFRIMKVDEEIQSLKNKPKLNDVSVQVEDFQANENNPNEQQTSSELLKELKEIKCTILDKSMKIEECLADFKSYRLELSEKDEKVKDLEQKLKFSLLKLSGQPGETFVEDRLVLIRLHETMINSNVIISTSDNDHMASSIMDTSKTYVVNPMMNKFVKFNGIDSSHGFVIGVANLNLDAVLWKRSQNCQQETECEEILIKEKERFGGILKLKLFQVLEVKRLKFKLISDLINDGYHLFVSYTFYLNDNLICLTRIQRLKKQIEDEFKIPFENDANQMLIKLIDHAGNVIGEYILSIANVLGRKGSFEFNEIVRFRYQIAYDDVNLESSDLSESITDFMESFGSQLEESNDGKVDSEDIECHTFTESQHQSTDILKVLNVNDFMDEIISQVDFILSTENVKTTGTSETKQLLHQVSDSSLSEQDDLSQRSFSSNNSRRKRLRFLCPKVVVLVHRLRINNACKALLRCSDHRYRFHKWYLMLETTFTIPGQHTSKMIRMSDEDRSLEYVICNGLGINIDEDEMKDQCENQLMSLYLMCVEKMKFQRKLLPSRSAGFCDLNCVHSPNPTIYFLFDDENETTQVGELEISVFVQVKKSNNN